jgi:guanylate kinase
MCSQAFTGRLFVLSAPSGVGKTTLIQLVKPLWPDLRFSVSATTRSPRPGEVHGEDYTFVDEEEFIRGIEQDRFLEWASVHGRYYGTDRFQVENWLAEGKDVLLDIDVQGSRQVRCSFPWAHTIFILPPSLDVLQQRLKERDTESAEQLATRLAAANREIQEAAWYEFIIINDDLEEAATALNAIFRACRCLAKYQGAVLKSFLRPQSTPNSHNGQPDV